ncbi:MAG: cadherin-like beta sandwich domain-containing protein [Nitrospira sp.]
MSTILISYRREDSADVTGRIYDRLIHEFGRALVFKDVDSIPYGIDFRKYLDEQVAKCEVFLAVIGPNWIRKRGTKGKSKLEDPTDFVRIEVESALKRQIPVIPVLVNGAVIPPADRLPTSIRDLSYRNGIVVRHDPDFHRDMDRLVAYLKLPGVIGASGTTAAQASMSSQLPALRGNNSLAGLAVSPGTLAPAFDANVQSYTVSVANNVGSINVTPTLSDPAATVTVNGQAAISGQARAITLNGPGHGTKITIIVTAQNGNDKTYLVTVSRGVSANNNLQGLAISPGPLAPAFNAGTVGYTVNVGSGVTQFTVTPTLQDTAATMTVNNQATNSGQARTIPLNAAGSSTFINIVVTAQNGAQKAYSVNVMRASLDVNNNLLALMITPGSMNPPFASGTLNYTVDLATDVTEVTVTATKSDSNAVLSGDVPNQGQATIPLDGPGTSKQVSIIVTASNGVSKTYALTVNRAAPASNNNLSALTVTPGTLVPAFAASTTTYTVEVPLSVDSLTVSSTKSDPNAVMSGDVPAGAGVATGQQTFVLTPLVPRSVSITVTALNGDTKTYSVTIVRTLF